MLLVFNTDLDLTPRKDTKIFVFELCMSIYGQQDLQTNLPISYVASLHFYIYDNYALVPDELHMKYPRPSSVVMQQATTNQQWNDGTPKWSDGKPYTSALAKKTFKIGTID